MVVVKLSTGELVSFEKAHILNPDSARLTILAGEFGSVERVPDGEERYCLVLASFNWNHVIGYAFEDGVFNDK